MPDPVPPNYWQIAAMLGGAGKFAPPNGLFADLSGDVSSARNALTSGKPIPQAINYPPVDRATDAFVSGVIEPGQQLGDWLSQQRGDNAPSLGAALGPATMAAIGFLPGPKGANAVGDIAKALAPEAKAASKGITVYHGSPHDFNAERLVRHPGGEMEYVVGTPNNLPPVPQGAEVVKDFPLGRFRGDKIGTGEGAQAYGVGEAGYHAENERVAKSYKPNDPITAAFREHRGLEPLPAGKMYKSIINADPEHFLHWDKPLSEQSEHVQKALSGANPNANEPLGSVLGRAYRNPRFAGDLIGKDTATADELTNGLAERGISGIKFLDQGSRFQPQQVEHLNTQIKGLEDMLGGASETKRPGIEAALKARRSELSDLQPTHNYVVFDDKMIDILKKYGLAGLGIPGLAAAAQDNRQ